VHDRLVSALRPEPGVRWLDVATGTGAVALRAAQAGADVTGVDLAHGLVETARKLAAGQGLRVRFDVGDAEELPYADESFDVVSSSMGAIFAPDHAAVARELARLLPAGGRLGFTAWRPVTGFSPVMRKYQPPPPEDADDSDDWGREEYVERLLGKSFELTLEPETMAFESGSGEEAWQLLTTSVGPFRATVAALEPDRLDGLHREFVNYLEAHRADGGIRLPGDYLLVLGLRR
jgi:ubiquinone/menaquinone biosynthesis C-methylase UbiE